MNAQAAKHNPFASRGVVGLADFTIGAEADDVINVAIQLKDHQGNNLQQRCCIGWYLSSDANGDALASAPDTVAIGTDGLLIEELADQSGKVICEADGDIDINIGKSGAATYYLVLVMPDGSLVVSDAITFAA